MLFEQGRGVQSATLETWFIWYSEEWTDSLLELYFTDTIYGDTLIAFRDNKGRSLESGPQEQIVSIHPRAIQAKPDAYYRYYSTARERNERLIYLSTTDYRVSGIDKQLDHPLSITDVYILPTDAGSDGRMPWIFMSYVVAKDKDGDGNVDGIPITETQRIDVCGVMDIESFVQNLGEIVQYPPYKCNLEGFFDRIRQSSVMPVMLRSQGIMRSDLLLMPSTHSVQACVLQLSFSSLFQISEASNRICFNTPTSFATNANLPTRPGWIDFQRKAWMGSDELTGKRSPTISQQGVTVMAKRIVAQNSLNGYGNEGGESKVQMFATSDPESTSHWLKQVRIGIHPDDSGEHSRSVSAESKHSQEVIT